MPNLTVAEAREELRDYMREMKPYALRPNPSDHFERLVNALLAAHDAEAVETEGAWYYIREGGKWWCQLNDFEGSFIECPDDATARLYAHALNRADQRRKEGV